MTIAIMDLKNNSDIRSRVAYYNPEKSSRLRGSRQKVQENNEL